jgi:TolA-binding protein
MQSFTFQYRIPYFSILLFSLALVHCTEISAQTVADNRRRYESGKELIRQGKYDLAQEIFRPLMREIPENPFAAYAHYFSALASFKANKPNDARLTLEQLQQKHPTWPDMDQANYLTANILLAKKEYAAALVTIGKIRNESVKRDAENLKKYYLQQEKNLSLLKELQQKNANDRIIAEVLMDKLWFSVNEEEKALAKKLDTQFNFKKAASMPVKKAEAKVAYNVAVVLPFEYNKLIAEKNGRVSPIAVDMYNGIRLAQQQLAKEDIQINLFAYDVGADADKMTAVVNMPDFQSNDLIIGPINGAAIRVAATFANQTRIGQINPITTNSQIVQNTAAAYLFQASVESQAKHVAQFARKQFAGPTAVVFYGTSSRDSLLAHVYRQKLIEAGGKVAAFRKLSTAADVPKMLATIDATPGLGHVFITSSDQNVAINLVSSLEKREEKIPVITYSNWLDYSMLSYDQFERLQFYFISPDYLDYRSEGVIAFKQAYIQARNLIPSIYAYQGYDMMLFFGRILKEFGTDFHNGLKSKSPVKGAIFAGYDYRNANDNQYVPIAKFENGNYTLVNPIGN